MRKVALITGSSGGIGTAAVRRFSSEEWSVVGVDRRAPESRDAAPDRFIQADLSREAEIEAVFRELSNTEGRLDALVNNAGLQVIARISSLTVEEWDTVMAVNLRAPFLCLREALPLLKRSRGSVVNVSSVHGSHTAPRMSLYAASKGGLDALTRSAALELAALGIRVNCVVPGAVDTKMLHSNLNKSDGTTDTALTLDELAGRHAIERIVEPEEIAELVYFLADSSRSSSLTGASVVADGGATVRLSTE